MLDKTLGYILCCQSPGLFLAAAVLVIAYFAGRRKHRFKAVLKLLLGIVCAVGGIALYYLGMYDEYFTIRDFYQIRPAGWVGVGIAAFFTTSGRACRYISRTEASPIFFCASAFRSMASASARPLARIPAASCSIA